MVKTSVMILSALELQGSCLKPGRLEPGPRASDFQSPADPQLQIECELRMLHASETLLD